MNAALAEQFAAVVRRHYRHLEDRQGNPSDAMLLELTQVAETHALQVASERPAPPARRTRKDT